MGAYLGRKYLYRYFLPPPAKMRSFLFVKREWVFFSGGFNFYCRRGFFNRCFDFFSFLWEVYFRFAITFYPKGSFIFFSFYTIDTIAYGYADSYLKVQPILWAKMFSKPTLSWDIIEFGLHNSRRNTKYTLVDVRLIVNYGLERTCAGISNGRLKDCCVMAVLEQCRWMVYYLWVKICGIDGQSQSLASRFCDVDCEP